MIGSQTYLAAAVLVAVLALVVTRPRGLNVGWPAAVGAVACLALRLLPWSALEQIVGLTWDASATLVALFILSAALESNGFFTWAARHLARAARGSGWALFALTLLLTTAVTALLANDGAVLMLTPIFATMLRAVHPDARSRPPFVLAAGFFADAMSGILVPSNLTNIIVADAHGLTFGRAALWMLAPSVCAFAAGSIAFGLRFRRQIAEPYDTAAVDSPGEALRDRPTFWVGWLVLAGLIVGYTLGGRAHWPVSWSAGVAALVMLACTRVRRIASVRALVRGAPWGVLFYALGMFVVITAAERAGVLAPLTGALRQWALPAAGMRGAVLSGSAVAALSAGVNNLPATLVGVLGLESVRGADSPALYAVLLGVDIGPKLTPFGSLATLLWLGLLEQNGVRITWGQYVRENAWITVVVLAAAFGGLAVSNAWLS